MKKILTITGLVLGLLSTGSALGGDEIDQKYHGTFDNGRLKDGEEEPTIAGCLRTKYGSKKGWAVLHATGGDFNTNAYVASETCEGDNMIKTRFSYVLKNESRTEDHQVVTIPSQDLTIEIVGALTVKTMNEKKVCGHSDWVEKVYKTHDEEMKACTFDNMAMNIPPYISDEVLQNWRTLIRLQGETGLGMASKATPDGEFGHVHYYVRRAN